MHSHEKLKVSHVKIVRTLDGSVLEFDIYSHFTAILGDSGEGKTLMLELLMQSALTNELSIDAEYPISYIENIATLDTALEVPSRRIIFIDESNVASAQGNLMRRINKSDHLFVCIGRTATCKGDYPLQGIYEFSCKGDWFTMKPATFLNVSQHVKLPIITEASENRSEHEVLKRYFTKILAAGGRNNIEKKLRLYKAATVFADLGNIGRAYYSIRKRLLDDPLSNLYDYQSFEQLIYVAMTEDPKIETNLDYTTIEEMYERLLSELNIGYQHGKPLPNSITDMNPEELFNNSIGKGILNAIDGGDQNA